jgi:hypothetical protein
MKMRSIVMLLVVAAMASLASATPITNGTFECTSCALNISRYALLPNNNTDITGWTVADGVVWVAEYNGTAGWQSADSLGSVVGLNSSEGGSPVWGSVSQTISGLTPSTLYTLFYSLSASPGGKTASGGGLNDWGYKQLNVQVAGTPADIVTYNYQSSNSAANMNWELHSYQFTTGAAQTSALLTFQSATTGSFFGAAVDNVYFQEGGVPEPGTFSLMIGAGLAGLAFLKFRK